MSLRDLLPKKQENSSSGKKFVGKVAAVILTGVLTVASGVATISAGQKASEAKLNEGIFDGLASFAFNPEDPHEMEQKMLDIKYYEEAKAEAKECEEDFLLKAVATCAGIFTTGMAVGSLIKSDKSKDDQSHGNQSNYNKNSEQYSTEYGYECIDLDVDPYGLEK